MSEDPVAFSIKVEPGDGDDPIVKMKNTMNEFKRTLPYQIEIQALLAKLQMAKFQSLVKEGFTMEQALFLVKDNLGK